MPATCEPGVRPEYHEDYYGAFLIDPDGSSAEAVYHGRAREGDNVIDHLRIRVADLAATRRFYETVVPDPRTRHRAHTGRALPRRGSRPFVRARARRGERERAHGVSRA